jgi:hypothetical protein
MSVFFIAVLLHTATDIAVPEHITLLVSDIFTSELHSQGNQVETKSGECVLPCSSKSFVFLPAT